MAAALNHAGIVSDPAKRTKLQTHAAKRVGVRATSTSGPCRWMEPTYYAARISTWCVYVCVCVQFISLHSLCWFKQEGHPWGAFSCLIEVWCPELHHSQRWERQLARRLNTDIIPDEASCLVRAAVFLVQKKTISFIKGCLTFCCQIQVKNVCSLFYSPCFLF